MLSGEDHFVGGEMCSNAEGVVCGEDHSRSDIRIHRFILKDTPPLPASPLGGEALPG